MATVSVDQGCGGIGTHEDLEVDFATDLGFFAPCPSEARIEGGVVLQVRSVRVSQTGEGQPTS